MPACLQGERVGNPEVNKEGRNGTHPGLLPYPQGWARVWQVPELKPPPPELRQGTKGTKVAWEEEGEGARHVT